MGMPGSANDADVILIFGGDGTVHRHLRQLARLQLPVLIVPRGSGNDFARALNLHGVADSRRAWKKFCGGGNVRTIDLGMIRPIESGVAGQSSEHFFCCVAGVGLDAEVARRANRLPRWLRGHGGYVLSLPPALFKFAPLPMKISVADGERPGEFVTRSAKPTVLVAFANAPAYGGGMKIAPRAELDDGKLEICIVRDMDKLKLFCLFPTVYFGRHLNKREVEYFQAERLRVETEKPLDVYADGEYVCRTPIEVSVARGAMNVIMG